MNENPVAHEQHLISIPRLLNPDSRLRPPQHQAPGDPNPHVQQRSPSVILRIKVLGLFTGPCNAFANCGNVLAM